MNITWREQPLPFTVYVAGERVKNFRFLDLASAQEAVEQEALAHLKKQADALRSYIKGKR